VEVAVDGESVGTQNDAPYVFTINKKLSDGNHVITARATDNNGASSDTSINITVGQSDQSLQIIDPNNGEGLTLPAELTAQSDKLYPEVTFYYQSGNSLKVIGTAGPSGGESGSYQYSVIWADNPKAGNYTITARSSSGVTSKKITVSVGQ
jgi:hypothetical protein